MRLKVTVVAYIDNYDPVGTPAYADEYTLDDCVALDATSEPFALLECCGPVTMTCEVVEDKK